MGEGEQGGRERGKTEFPVVSLALWGQPCSMLCSYALLWEVCYTCVVLSMTPDCEGSKETLSVLAVGAEKLARWGVAGVRTARPIDISLWMI